MLDNGCSLLFVLDDVEKAHGDIDALGGLKCQYNVRSRDCCQFSNSLCRFPGLSHSLSMTKSWHDTTRCVNYTCQFYLREIKVFGFLLQLHRARWSVLNLRTRMDYCCSCIGPLTLIRHQVSHKSNLPQSLTIASKDHAHHSRSQRLRDE